MSKSIDDIIREEHARFIPDPPHSGFGPFVPKLVDVFFEDRAYVWYRLHQSTPDFDLDMERFEGNQIGETPEWMEEYEDVSTLMHKLTQGSYSSWTGFNFALTEGIMPGQPFLLELGMPRWYRCSYEYNEWDVDYDIEIVRVLPRDPQKVTAWIDRATFRKKRYEEKRARELEELRTLRQTDLSAMFLEQSYYFVDPPGYDDMAIPTGKSVSLCTTHTALPGRPTWGRTDLVYGQDPDSWEKAFENLYTAVEKTLGFTKQQIENLPKKWRR